MKTYHLDVITGAQTGIKRYQVEADGFDVGSTGYYQFFTKKIGERGSTTVAMFPVNRTVIKYILDDEETDL